MKQSTIEVIEAFAKNHKIGRAKVQALVENVLSDTKPSGKPPHPSTLVLREKVKALKGSGEQVTAKQLAQRLQATPVEVNNTLRYFGCVQVGKKPKATGERGKQEVIWQL